MVTLYGGLPPSIGKRTSPLSMGTPSIWKVTLISAARKSAPTIAVKVSKPTCPDEPETRITASCLPSLAAFISTTVPSTSENAVPESRNLTL